MSATLRVVLDQVVAPTSVDLASASRELGRALIGGAPRGCDVAGIVPSAGGEAFDVLAETIPGLVSVYRAGLARRELSAAWQLGVAVGVGGGMIHSPTSLAPLVRHDRLHDHDQTVVTMWDLAAWEEPTSMPKQAVAWHRSMLKRAEKYADAVVVPTHAMAEQLADRAKLAGRIRVIAGAAPASFGTRAESSLVRGTLGLPADVLVVDGAAALGHIETALKAIASGGGEPAVIVLDVVEGHEPQIADLAAAAGIGERDVHVRGALNDGERGAILADAAMLVAPSTLSGFPWRVVEALTLGTPVVAANSAVHREVMVDGGTTGDGVDGLAEAIGQVLADRGRYAVLAADRGRAFSWRDAADRVWQLHAEL